MTSKIKILIADDHPIFRRGLRAVIESDHGFEIVAEADNGEEALRKIVELEPDVAVLDVNMPGLDGLGVARRIQSKNLPTVPVFLTMHTDEAIFNAALEADVKGFVIKEGAANEIVACIRETAAGRRYFSRVLTDFLLNRRQPAASPLESLTASERRVLRLISESKSTREIADELFISPRTVDHHRANIASKLNLKGKHALLTFALTHKSEIL
ncbi:MAG: response regulator transcription factor [Acidobacteria bacterium]|nr:response regulator transcription factor [Acidobacteriota bacterium]